MSQKQQRTIRVRYIYFRIFFWEKLLSLNFQKANSGTHLPRCVPKALQSKPRDFNPTMKRFFHPAVSFQFLCKSFWCCTACVCAQHTAAVQRTELRASRVPCIYSYSWQSLELIEDKATKFSLVLPELKASAIWIQSVVRTVQECPAQSTVPVSMDCSVLSYTIHFELRSQKNRLSADIYNM